MTGSRAMTGRCPNCAAARGQLCIKSCPNSDPTAPGQPGNADRGPRVNEFLVRYAALCAELGLHFFAHGMHTEGYLIVEELPPEGPMMPESVE